MKNKSLGFTHKCGILMPISSLPSKYGIGSFGKEAFDFVDFLSESGQKCWQVLPLNPTSYGDSPYQSPASASGNPYYIDLSLLQKAGLLTKEELKGAQWDTKRVDYGYLFNERYTVLRKAHSRFVPTKEYKRFLKKNSEWIYDYALFMALKCHYDFCEWTKWEPKHRDVKEARKYIDEFKCEMEFWQWVQYAFDTQWQALREYAHSKGIVIIGDMPIYVALDSMDVWCSPKQFLLDDEYNPIVVAGCPPDAFSDDGQLWGNPIYNWQVMSLDDFAWWKKRVGRAFMLYDILRIDHFRGFASFYAVPFGDENAKRGNWISAPGKELFDAIKEAYPKAKIIAEDLGFITDDVRELLKYTGFPGMKILQFAFDEADNEYLPRMYKSSNSIVYTGSHDSECTKSWYKGQSKSTRQIFKKECKIDKGQSPTYAMIELALGSIADLAIIPMQDYLELTSEEGRMNTPSVADGNWQWKLRRGYNTQCLKKKIGSLAIKHKRQNKR